MTTVTEDLELIERALLNHQCEYDDHGALEAFRELFGRTWIKCSEHPHRSSPDRMPEDGQAVFFVAMGEVLSGDFDDDGSGYFNHDDPSRGGVWDAEHVSHWMPRFVMEAPEPPKEPA